MRLLPVCYDIIILGTKVHVIITEKECPYVYSV